MGAPDTDKIFAGSISDVYEKRLVPLIIEPYAAECARRLARHAPLGRVLEIAGTGSFTRSLASALSEGVAIVATNVDGSMLDAAAASATARPVQWRQTGAMALPFADESFDAVACQFGVMSFADKARAYAEARRVLRPGGVLLFSVWDRIEENEFADVVSFALAALFPDDPPHFLVRTLYGYWHTEAIAEDLARAGFGASPQIATVAARSRADSPLVPAIAYCQGTPLRDEIELRAPEALVMATDFAGHAIAHLFGDGPIDARIQAHIVTVAK